MQSHPYDQNARTIVTEINIIPRGDEVKRLAKHFFRIFSHGPCGKIFLDRCLLTKYHEQAE